MSTITHWLYEDKNYRMTAHYESVHLMPKQIATVTFFESDMELSIGDHYGDPTSGLMIHGEEHTWAISAGCGIVIYNLNTRELYKVGNDPKDILWTDALHTSLDDNEKEEFRFVSFNTQSETKVFKMNVLTRLYEQVD